MERVPVSKQSTATEVIPLVAKSPFELRVDLGGNLPESEVRSALASGDMGFLHSFTTGSAVDGPGVRVVAWTSGCMWRCLYCHNPDTWTMANGMPVTVARAAAELRKYRYGLKIMSGGLTISGGEPLMQHRFVVKLLAAAKAMGVHTTLETNGYHGDRLTDDELDGIDLVMLGIKTWDPQRHHRLTGMDNAPTLEFARRLAARGRKMWIRFVLVPGLDRRSRGCREHRALCRESRQRRARGSVAVSPDGELQVGAAGPGLHARDRPAAAAGAGRGNL